MRLVEISLSENSQDLQTSFTRIALDLTVIAFFLSSDVTHFVFITVKWVDMGLAQLFVGLRCVFNSRVVVMMGLGATSLLSACTTRHCDKTGAMASHCTPAKAYVFTGEAFEEDKMFYYRTEDEHSPAFQAKPATSLSQQVLKGQQDYHTIWSKDRSAKKVIFYKRPASF